MRVSGTKCIFLKFATVISAAGAAVGVSAQATPGWTTPTLIESFIPTESGLIIIQSTSNNPMHCASSTWAFIAADDPNYALISSTILTAFSQAKPIRTWQSGCHPDGKAKFVAVWVDR